MLRNAGLSILPKTYLSPRHYERGIQHFSTFTPGPSYAQIEPNKPLQLDPAIQTALQDESVSFNTTSRQAFHGDSTLHKELELLSRKASEQFIDDEIVEETDAVFPRAERKSPAASFGSRQIGTIILPYEMQSSIVSLIAESEKALVHADADRLFNPQRGDKCPERDGKTPSSWFLHYTPSQHTEARSSSKISHIKARSNKVRDGTAFASVVMPAQYAVIRAVLEQTKSRLGDTWAQKINRVFEWGSGTGAGLWAAHHTFQKPNGRPSLNTVSSDAVEATHQTQKDSENPQLRWSNLKSYVAIEKRDGLSNIARKLLKDVPIASSVSIQREFKSEHGSPPRLEHNKETIAMSAFLLNTIQTTGMKKALLREMWNSGADLMIIIEDASLDGFQNISDARDFLLRLANKPSGEEQNQMDDEYLTDPDVPSKQGAHVLAPCPHDKQCPLAFHQKISASKRAFELPSLTRMDRCTFMQRLQRPSFVRLTKHAKRGEEDVGYSYIVIRRGARTRPPFAVGQLQGREGAVARWAEEAKQTKEDQNEDQWIVYEDDIGSSAGLSPAEESTVPERTQQVATMAADQLGEKDSFPNDSLESEALSPKHEDLENMLREESYSWPRINFTPLKRNGHVVIDACMPEGSIMRMTFPRSQGKQIYYDARKCSWGDIFPHAPKHRPIPRFTGRPGKTVKSLLKETMDEDDVKEEREMANQLDPLSYDKAKKVKRSFHVGGAADSASATRTRWSKVIYQLKEERKRKRKERRKTKDEKEMEYE